MEVWRLNDMWSEDGSKIRKTHQDVRHCPDQLLSGRFEKSQISFKVQYKFSGFFWLLRIPNIKTCWFVNKPIKTPVEPHNFTSKFSWLSFSKVFFVVFPKDFNVEMCCVKTSWIQKMRFSNSSKLPAVAMALWPTRCGCTMSSPSWTLTSFFTHIFCWVKVAKCGCLQFWKAQRLILVGHLGWKLGLTQPKHKNEISKLSNCSISLRCHENSSATWGPPPGDGP